MEHPLNDRERRWSEDHVCPACGQRGAHVEFVTLSGTGPGRWLAVDRHEYALVTCLACGHTSLFNLHLASRLSAAPQRPADPPHNGPG
jgi:predicted nucleic-acid-binding Zn-ribbon protein